MGQNPGAAGWVAAANARSRIACYRVMVDVGETLLRELKKLEHEDDRIQLVVNFARKQPRHTQYARIDGHTTISYLPVRSNEYI